MFYKFTVGCAYIVVAALLVGFFVLGNIKSISNYKSVSPIISSGVVLIVLIITPIACWVVSTFNRVTHDMNMNGSVHVNGSRIQSREKDREYAPNSGSKPGSDADSDSGNININQDQIKEIQKYQRQMLSGSTTAGFIAGNVCYEILFSAADSPTSWINQYYFLMLSVTFTCGVSSVVICTLMSLCIGGLPTVQAKHVFITRLHSLKVIVFIISTVCLLSWQASIMAIGEVKYTGEKKDYDVSIVYGLAGLVALMATLIICKSISDSHLVRYRQQQAQTQSQIPLREGVSNPLNTCE